MGHNDGSISAEISHDIEGNGIGNDWSGNFCEFDIDDQLNGSVCNVSEVNEESIEIYSMSILISNVFTDDLILPHVCFHLKNQVK